MHTNPHSKLPLGRRDTIASRLASGQAVNAVALAQEFQVSEDAIRRDLRALAADGLCRRVYGGALPLSPITQPLMARVDTAHGPKRALAQTAAQTVLAGELVFLDCGSTQLALVDYLPEDMDVCIATNSIDIAAAVLKRADLELLMIGGSVSPAVGGSVDAGAVQTIGRMQISRCFIGCCGVSPQGALSCLDAADAFFKRTLIRASQHVSTLLTNAKFSTLGRHCFAEPGQIQSAVVEHDAPAAGVDALSAGGLTILRAKA